MSTTNYVKVCQSQKVADLEPKAKGRPFFSAKSPATLQREAAEARYEARSNACPACFTARSRTGACACV